MKGLNRLLVTLIALVLLISIPLHSFVYAAENSTATYRAKDEVVYGTLMENGDNEAVYVVNVFEVTSPGTIVDYGEYEAVKNMTNLSEVTNGTDRVQFEVEEGKFYYQGDLKKDLLPWDFSVSYLLDGKEISPNELLGKSGKVEININSVANETANMLFFEHYMLQVSLTFDVERFSNIKAEDATIANAGKMEQVTFTVLPEKEANLTVTANVTDFEMDGIEIVGLPFVMAIDEMETDDMVDDMGKLTDAISELHDGVANLNDGVGKLSSGTGDLYEGSKQFHEGLQQLNRASKPLVNGSKEINDALQQMQDELSFVEDVDLSELLQLSHVLEDLATNLATTGNALQQLGKGYEKASQNLEQAVNQIPERDEGRELTNDDWRIIRQSLSKEKFIYLQNHYIGAQMVKGLFGNKEFTDLFKSTGQTLKESGTGMIAIADGLFNIKKELDKSLSQFSEMNELGKLVSGLNDFTTQYSLFHQGIINYTKGVNELTNTYSEIHGGISELTKGTDDLATGTDELHDGTGKLRDETATLPEDMQDEIDEFMKTYDHSDFKATSFVSPKNEAVELVQFIIKTKEIKQPEEETSLDNNLEKKGYWQMLKELFTFTK